MTERKDLLRPLEPAQRLAAADRETLGALLADVAGCTTLIVGECAAQHQATANQPATLQACIDALGRPSGRIDAAGRDDSARHVEPTASVRQIPVAVTGLGTALDAAGAARAAGIRADLTAPGGTLDRVARTREQHDQRLGAMTDAVTALFAPVAALCLAAHSEHARQARTGQTRTLGDHVKATASLAARLGRFEQALSRRRTDFRLHTRAIPLLPGCAFSAGMMTGFVIRYLDGSAGQSARPETGLMPWPPLAATQE